MAIFALRKKNRKRPAAATVAATAVAAAGQQRRRGPGGMTLTAGLAALPLAALCAWTAAGTAAWADTTGDSNVSGGAVLAAILGNNGVLIDPGTGTAVNLTTTSFTYIKNDYMAVVVGINGTYTIGGVTHTIPGRISFGNIGGNLRSNGDNLQPLNGNQTNVGGAVAPTGVWPLPGSYYVISNGFAGADFPAYVRAAVDVPLVNGQILLSNAGTGNGTGTGGQFVDVGFDVTKNLSPPAFRDNAIIAEYQIIPPTGSTGGGTGGGTATGPGVTLKEEIKLFRNTARLKWTLSNYDTVPHTVYLRFAVNNRGITNQSGTVLQGAYLVDPITGTVPDRPVIYGLNPDNVPQSAIPPTIDIYGARYQDQSLTALAPFHSRQLFTADANGTNSAPGASRPISLMVADSVDLSPDSGFTTPGAFTAAPLAQRDVLVTGVATGAIYGPFTLRAGSLNQEVITNYYGNGSSTDVLTPDFTVGSEAEEALQYNSAAADPANRPAYTGSNFADVVKAFLSPSTLTIFSSLYNQQLDNATGAVDLRNVSVTVTLPTGLRFATDPATGAQDTSTKQLGTIPSDRDGIARFLVEPTGQAFGSLVYQQVVSVGDPNPLSRSISRAINVPATPLYPVTREAYQGIGFPFQFDPVLSNNADRDTVLFGITGRPTNAEPGAFFGWDALTQKYVKDITKLATGKGYFIKPPTDRVIVAKGVKPFPNQAPLTLVPDANNTPTNPSLAITGLTTTSYYQDTLEAGWNFISNPYLYDIPVNSLRLAAITPNDPNGNLNQVSFQQAVASGIVRGSVYFWNLNLNSGQGDWDFLQGTDAILRPWQGYWIYLNDRRVLRVVAPGQAQSAILPDDTGTEQVTRKRLFANTGAIEKGKAVAAGGAMDNWKLQLAARTKSGMVSGSTFIGVNPQAKDGDDIRDMPKPPAMGDDTLDVAVVRPSTDGKIGEPTRLMQDLRSSDRGGTKSWQIQVASGKGGQVTLNWPNLSQLPKQLRLVLKDEQTGQSVTLRGTSSYTANIPSGGRAATFTITASRQLSTPLALNNMHVEGARTRGVDGTRQYSIAVTPTADASVTGRITSLNGGTIAVFETHRSVPGGRESRLSWNGRAQNGATLPVGVYMVELTAETESGERLTVKKPLTMLR